MKKLLIGLIILASFPLWSQSEYPEFRNVMCNSLMEFDEIKIEENYYKYRIVSLYRTGENYTVYVGEIILPGFYPSSNKEELIKLLTAIGKKEKFSGFDVYPSCESLKIFVSSTGYSWEQREENMKLIIGNVMIN